MGFLKILVISKTVSIKKARVAIIVSLYNHERKPYGFFIVCNGNISKLNFSDTKIIIVLNKLEMRKEYAISAKTVNYK